MIGKGLSKDPQLARFFKGVAVLRHQAPKYSTTWDPEPVLVYVATLHPNEDISLEQLTKKLVSLLALIAAQRVQTLRKILLEKNYHSK